MELMVFLLIQALNFSLAYKFNIMRENNHLYEQSVAHILKSEAKETGNKFTIIFNSLDRNDEHLNKLCKELSKNDIASIIFEYPKHEQEYVSLSV